MSKDTLLAGFEKRVPGHNQFSSNWLSCPDVQSRDVKPVKRRQTIGQRRLITINYDEIHRFRGYQTHGYCIWIGRISDFSFLLLVFCYKQLYFVDTRRLFCIPITQGMFMFLRVLQSRLCFVAATASAATIGKGKVKSATSLEAATSP